MRCINTYHWEWRWQQPHAWFLLSNELRYCQELLTKLNFSAFLPLVLCRQSSQRKRSKYPRGTVSVGASAVSHQSRQNGLNLEPEYTIKDNFLTSLHHHLKIWKGKHILGVHHGPKGPVLASGLLGRHPAGEDRPAVTFRASECHCLWPVSIYTALCVRPADAIATPSSLAPVKSRKVYLSGDGLMVVL